jgi:transcription antitermination factor NusG
MALGAPLEPAPLLKEGMRVEVRTGPFKGMQGTITGRGKTGRLILSIAMLGQGAALEIDTSLLDPLD